MKDFRITILCDNTTSTRGLMAECGFAALIERENEFYLFDTGPALALVNNALVLGKDLRRTRKIFLSHGHYDHTGGLFNALSLANEAEICAHPNVFINRFRVRNGKTAPIGFPFNRSRPEKVLPRFYSNSQFFEVAQNMFLTGEIPRTNNFETGDAELFAEVEGELVPDSFKDDQALVIDSLQGLVIVLGCAHAGIINTLSYVAEKMRNENIYAVVGGSHLEFAGERQVEETLDSLKRFRIRRLGACHCTGREASLRMSQEFGDAFFYADVGTTLEIG